MSEQFWQAYAKACLDIVNSPPLGSDQAIFIASTGDRAIAAGKDIPFQITNDGIFKNGDALQTFSDAYFSSSADNSYVQRLSNYLAAAVTDKGDPNAKDAFTAASKDAMDANSAYMTQQKTDMAAFTSDTSKPQGISFPDWASLNDPNLQILSQNRDALTSKLQQARLQYLGSDAGQLNNYFTNANSANTQTRFPEAGINMQCCGKALNELQQTMQNQRSGGQQAQVLDTQCFYRAEYDLDPLYAEQLDRWAKQTNPTQHTTVTMSEGSSSVYQQLGLNNTSGTSFNAGWLSWDDTKVQQAMSSKAYNSSSSAADISLTINWSDMALFNIAPGGTWNVNAPSLYPHTIDGFHGTAPWARAAKLLCASGVTLTLKFSNQAKQDFATDFSTNSQTKTNGVNVFGFHCDTSETNQTSDVFTHNGSYSAQDGTLTITPRPLAQTCTLLGVIANKVTI